MRPSPLNSVLLFWRWHQNICLVQDFIGRPFELEILRNSPLLHLPTYALQLRIRMFDAIR
jgi:hypothetical protein